MPDNLSPATEDNRVVSIRTRRKFQPSGIQQNATPPSGDLDRYAQSGEPDDFRHRMVMNAIAFVFVGALVLAGFWLADTITTMRKTQDCVLIGKRDCAPIEAPSAVR